MKLAFVVLLDALDDGDLAGQRDVEHVAAAAGRRRTRSPSLHSMPAISNVIERRLVFEQLPFPLVHCVSSFSGRRPRSTPCSFMNCSAGMCLGAFQHPAGALVGFAHLALLFVGQGHDAQRKNLVDLGAVEEIARALGRDLRIVVEDDRRGEHACRRLFAGQHGPGADVLALRGLFLEAFRRIEQRDELAVLDAENGVRRDQGLSKSIDSRVSPDGGRRSCSELSNLHGDLEDFIVAAQRSNLDGAVQGLPFADDDANWLALFVAKIFDRSCRRENRTSAEHDRGTVAAGSRSSRTTRVRPPPARVDRRARRVRDDRRVSTWVPPQTRGILRHVARSFAMRVPRGAGSGL